MKRGDSQHSKSLRIIIVGLLLIEKLVDT